MGAAAVAQVAGSPQPSGSAQPITGAATATFEEDPPRERPEAHGAPPLLRLSTFEGRLDWLLELARARKVDLARLSLVEVADQLIAALDTAAERDSDIEHAASLPRRSEWVIMGATLAELRSRLLLPADTAVGRQAREEAAALRDQLVERERMVAGADWLDAQPQLGRDVFARGCAAGVKSAPRARSTDLTALLRACLAALQAEVARGERYLPVPLPLWRVPDAIARITRLLPALRDAAPSDTSLWRFLPDAECLASAGLARDTVPDPGLLCRSMVASTLVAGLELAREGALALGQEESFGAIQVKAVQGGAAEAGEEVANGRCADAWS